MGLLSKLFNCSSPPALKANGPQRNNITCDYYSIRGKNPDTGRMKRVCVVAETTASEEEIQKRSGLLPPYEMEEKDSPAYDGPTEKQLAYAQRVGIFIPADATSGDATVFLTRYEEGRPLCAPPTPDRIIRLLMDRGIVLPAYAGVYEASNLYFHNIALEERIAFFAMRVYCSLYRAKYCLLEDAPQSERERFFDFARKYQGNNDFVRSLLCYTGADLPLDSCTISKKLKAYNMVADFFKR